MCIPSLGLTFLFPDSAGGAMFSHNIGEITNSGQGNLTVNAYPRTFLALEGGTVYYKFII